MARDQLSALTQTQRDRLAFIDLRVRYIGEIRRPDLVSRFGVQAAAATRDIALYKELAPRNLDYDSRGKVYVYASSFRPLFVFKAERVLCWLSQGLGDVQPQRFRPVISCDMPDGLHEPNAENLAVVSRAIHRGSVVEMTYRALTSGLTSRQISPFALAGDGLRWHVRAFDRRSSEFRDFVLTRIVDARGLDEVAEEQERVDQDIQWNRIVELDLVPHPANVQNPDTIEAEYGMEEGVKRVRLRAALAGYMLRRWNVDCTEHHSLKGAEYHLWLRNRQALYGVSNLVLAPGYESSEKA